MDSEIGTEPSTERTTDTADVVRTAAEVTSAGIGNARGRIADAARQDARLYLKTSGILDAIHAALAKLVETGVTTGHFQQKVHERGSVHF